MTNIKRILLFITLNVLCFSNIYSQNVEIQELTKQRKIISNEIKVLKDSIGNIEKRINFLKSKDNIETGEVAIAKVGTLVETRIMDKPHWSGNVVAIIPKYRMIEVYSFHEGFWLIQSDSIKGYADRESIGIHNSMREIIKEYDLIGLSKQYSEKTAIKISNHRIWIGMTPDMARKSIGKPKDINKSTGSYGSHEQWVYDNRYLYFENGKLTSWQD